MGALTPSIPNPPAPPPRPKNWFQRHWVLAIVGSCFVLMLLFAGFLATIFAVVETSFKKSDSYVQALAKARSNPPVMEKFGQPLEPGWFGSGNIQVTGPSGSADFEIPITGPKRKAKSTWSPKSQPEAGIAKPWKWKPKRSRSGSTCCCRQQELTG